jgi:hypothetical protein
MRIPIRDPLVTWSLADGDPPGFPTITGVFGSDLARDAWRRA